MLIIFGTPCAEILASKRMHNFSPHLSFDLTLPENTLITEYSRCIPSGTRRNCTALPH